MGRNDGEEGESLSTCALVVRTDLQNFLSAREGGVGEVHDMRDEGPPSL